MRHARQLESHLHTAQSAREHEIVEVAEVADAEDLVLQAPETGAQRHIEMIEHDLAKFVRRVAGWSEEGRQGVAVFGGVESHDLETPCAGGAPRRFAVALVPREDI